ncbi:hypothetical protein LshimejAT787_0500860 [Lyophyllum shimeji]|uniref:Uncharacterized protein n=1 Tax=Lyophyllum shimeji TaxID=47721 RepID=A0A9P3PMW0_LYOSH|nr:hypothetical protein LshimejAT787_0500860 [Lyophyllum shimeji]
MRGDAFSHKARRTHVIRTTHPDGALMQASKIFRAIPSDHDLSFRRNLLYREDAAPRNEFVWTLPSPKTKPGDGR